MIQFRWVHCDTESTLFEHSVLYTTDVVDSINAELAHEYVVLQWRRHDGVGFGVQQWTGWQTVPFDPGGKL